MGAEVDAMFDEVSQMLKQELKEKKAAKKNQENPETGSKLQLGENEPDEETKQPLKDPQNAAGQNKKRKKRGKKSKKEVVSPAAQPTKVEETEDEYLDKVIEENNSYDYITSKVAEADRATQKALERKDPNLNWWTSENYLNGLDEQGNERQFKL